jgi:hypothetical protein
MEDEAMVTRHEFLAQLHELLRPKVYLEIGVHTGQSLRLAQYSETAIGIDPNPMVGQPPANSVIWPMTSDEFFEREHQWLQDNRGTGISYIPLRISLAFIDGMHLFENALTDFYNVEQHMARGGIVVLDDVLPYNQAIAERVQPPGDWTGDVWKVWYALQAQRPDLYCYLVNTEPTGTMVITNPSPRYDWSPDTYWNWGTGDLVPGAILNRVLAVPPADILEMLREQLATTE